MKEVWKPVPNSGGKYLVSNLGQVKSFRRLNPEGNILRQYTNYNGGYFYIDLYTEKGKERWFVHRLVATMFCRKRKNKIQVDHVNGNRLDNRAANLEWVTPYENFRRSVVNGRVFLKSGQSGNRKLTENQVIAIKKAVRYGQNKKDIAEKYGIAVRTINSIMKGERWKHVP